VSRQKNAAGTFLMTVRRAASPIAVLDEGNCFLPQSSLFAEFRLIEPLLLASATDDVADLFWSSGEFGHSKGDMCQIT
jgi:hypothetical protein